MHEPEDTAWTSNSSETALATLLIPLPPPPEQRRLATLLMEQVAAVERARDSLNQQLRAATDLLGTFLREEFNKHETLSWPNVRLGDVVRLRKDVVHPRDHPRGPAIFVGLEHIDSQTGIRTGSDEVEMSLLTGRKPRFRQGDIVYGYLRPYLNKVWIAESDGLCSVDQYVYIVDTNRAATRFVAWFMRSPVYLERAPINTTPGQLPRIRTDEVAAVEIDLPPLGEQQRIADELDRKLEAVVRLRKNLNDQGTAIGDLPSALLHHAFAGGN